MTRPDLLPGSGNTAGTPPPSLDEIVAALRRLAVLALDAGYPLPAARIAGTADRVEAEAARELPQRPDYRGR